MPPRRSRPIVVFSATLVANARNQIENIPCFEIESHYRMSALWLRLAQLALGPDDLTKRAQAKADTCCEQPNG